VDTGEISIERPSAPRRDRKRTYKILIDQKPAGVLGAGESRTIRLATGQYVVQLKIDWLDSVALTVNVLPGTA
jgi:hypothetical protein